MPQPTCRASLFLKVSRALPEPDAWSGLRLSPFLRGGVVRAVRESVAETGVDPLELTIVRFDVAGAYLQAGIDWDRSIAIVDSPARLRRPAKWERSLTDLSVRAGSRLDAYGVAFVTDGASSGRDRILLKLGAAWPLPGDGTVALDFRSVLAGGHLDVQAALTASWTF